MLKRECGGVAGREWFAVAQRAGTRAKAGTGTGAVGGTTLRHAIALTAAVLLAAMLGACSSKGSSSSTGSGSGSTANGTISVDAVHAAAAKLGSAGGACPLGLDVNAALKAAGASGTAAPDTQSGPAAVGSTPETADAGSPVKQYSFSTIECSYVITAGSTTTDLTVRLGAMPSGEADTVAALLAPWISRDGRLTSADLQSFLSAKFTAGQTKVTPGAGTAVYTQLVGTGTGVGVEVATADSDSPTATPALNGAALEKVATTLAAQIH